ncbi:chalcone isomerase [Tanacetum coccineum]
MAKLHSSTGIELKSVFVPPSFKPPSATKTLFLVGAGDQPYANAIFLEIMHKVYDIWQWMEPSTSTLSYVYTLCTCPFEKSIHVTMLVPVTGKFFSELAAEKMVGLWKEEGTYNDADAKTIAKYLEVFKDENIKPGDAIVYTILPDGSATVSPVLIIAPCDATEPWQLGSQDTATPMMQGIIDLHHDIFFFLILILVFVSRILVCALWHFQKDKASFHPTGFRDGIIPEIPFGVIENKKWGPTQLDGMIGKNGVFPEVRQCVTSRLPELFN